MPLFRPDLLADARVEAEFLSRLSSMDASAESLCCALERFGLSNPEALRRYAEQFSKFQNQGHSPHAVKHVLSKVGLSEPGMASLLRTIKEALSGDPSIREADLLHTLEIYDGDLTQSLRFLSASQTLQNMGFSSDQVQQSLLLHQLDIDSALADLIPRSSPY